MVRKNLHTCRFLRVLQLRLMMKTYETELPNGYVETKVIDVKDKKFGIIMNVVAIAVLIITLVITWFILFAQFDESFSEILLNRILVFDALTMLLRVVIFMAAMIAYIVLHELTHGAVYKALTKQKLTFGLTLTAAYCGVPNIYVYRTTALLSLLAPFCVFFPVFLVPMFFLNNYLDVLLFAFMFGMHVGGCSGDLYDTFLYLFKYRDPSTLMRDYGPKQIFYVKTQNED